MSVNLHTVGMCLHGLKIVFFVRIMYVYHRQRNMELFRTGGTIYVLYVHKLSDLTIIYY